jgi:aldehyde:ferredoxin oxidoreductase
MTGGYMGKMLFVDLAQARVWEEVLEESLCRNFLGGYGLGARVLFTRQKAGVDPLGQDSILGFVTGPLTGTPALFGSRYAVVGKSPLTGTWGDANSGGDFGPYLKFSGYDAVFFLGISPSPVYLLIDVGKAQLRDAGELWGKDTGETESALQAKHGGDTHVSCIGPSGEQVSLISCIINNRGRAAGRSGLGAVMGSKKLKAIAVKGDRAVPVAHEPELKEARTKYLGQLGGMVSVFRDFGTSGGLSALVEIGDSPIKNWKGSPVDFSNSSAISDKSIIDLQERKFGCWRCPVSCGGLMKAGTGQYRYPSEVHKPEYETLAAFGSMCLNDNLESIIQAAEICNSSGLDTISAGSTIAFAIECYENGIIDNRDTEGIELKWGNHQAIVEMTRKLARREGFGRVLADGTRMAAGRIKRGAEELAVHIHGQEVAMHDPRRYMHFAISYLDSTPARHTQGNYATKPVSGLEYPAFDRHSTAGRGGANKMGSDLTHLVNSAGMCLLGMGFMPASAVTDFINLATGWDLGMDDLLKIGERVANMRQAFNAREGVNINDYKFPGRTIGNPALETGPTAGKTVDLETLRKDFLAARGWDVVTGRPGTEKLIELGLDDVADALSREGRA